MSLITQCPACATMFRVVPDQLRISEGWVRCGQCEEVFDANAHLRTLQDEVSPPIPNPPSAFVPSPTEAPAPAHPKPVSTAQDPNAGYDWGPVLPAAESPAEMAVGAEDLDASYSAPVLAAEPGHEPGREPYLHEPAWHDDAATPAAAPEVDGNFAHEVPEPRAHDPAPADKPASAMADSPTALDQVPLSFMAERPAPSAARRNALRYLLVALGLLLTALLALQILVQERDRMAATSPALRPLLAGICAPLDCRISAPRQIDAIAIESSSFTSLRAGVYVLHLVLKNAAASAVATPALELTLTNTQDQAIVRRVLEPAALGGFTELEAGAERSLSIPIQAVTAEAVPAIAGYKLLAFYP